jgi:ubiquinone/menaquinone biosynthesis C-methylase UbiE
LDRLLEVTGRAEATHFWFRGFRRFVQHALCDVTRGRADLRVLDCGCGTGHNLSWLCSYGRAVGFDLSRGGVDQARQAGRAVVRADFSQIPFPSASFDLAVSFDVFQCLPDEERAIVEMARVVRPGGALVITLAALDVLGADHAELWQEVRRYTPRSAKQLVARAGLVTERVSFLFASVFPLMLAVRLAQRVARPYRAIDGDADMHVPPAPVNDALTWLLGAEAAVSRYVPMPIGSSLLVVARKPG